MTRKDMSDPSIVIPCRLALYEEQIPLTLRMHYRCLSITPEAKPPGTHTKACNPSYVCVRVCEHKFSSALNWGQRKLIQLSVEANNLLFSKIKKCLAECWWCKLSLLNTHTHTHRVQTAVPFQWCHHQRTLLVALMDDVFLNFALWSPTTQLFQAGRLKVSVVSETDI